MTSPYEELLQICQKSPLYIVRLRKIAELAYMVSEIIIYMYDTIRYDTIRYLFQAECTYTVIQYLQFC